MSFRSRLLVCGFEPEQGIGQPHYPAERWWVHAAVFSSQGPLSIPWWPVPEDTRKGDLFVLRLAPFGVPPEVRAELGDRRFEFGRGAVGGLAAEAVDYMGFGLFGGDVGEPTGKLPDHPEFDQSREVLGDGLIGFAVAHSEAVEMGEISGLFEARVGTFVPFPDVIPESDVASALGAPFDDLTTPMRHRRPEQIEIPSGEFDALTRFVFDYFSGDQELVDATLRLKEVATGLGQQMSYFSTGLSPKPRWSFGVGSTQRTSGGEWTSNDFTSFTKDADTPSPIPPPRLPNEVTDQQFGALEGSGIAPESTAPDGTPSVGELVQSVLGERRSDGPYGEEAFEIVEHAANDLLMKLRAWADSDRGPDDPPFETVLFDAGAAWLNMDLPPTELKRPSLEDRVGEIFPILVELSPAPAVCSFVHRKKLYLLLAACEKPGAMNLSLHRIEIPPPGEALGRPEEVDVTGFSVT